jgi:threonine dehydrogenase-like Zn-dependent dehydrogenase
MKAKAAVFTGPRKPFEIRHYDPPEVEPGAALIKVRLANLCGSDLHMWRGESPFPPGMVAGHEMVGTVERLGEGLITDAAGRPLEEGDRVVYPYFHFCGTCRPCTRGKRTACQNKLRFWVSPADDPPHFRGAYAEYYYLPPGTPLYKVPDEIPDEVVAPANCALSQVIYGLHVGGLSLGESVMVQGAGGLGLYCTAVAKQMGASMVIVADVVRERLEMARRFGADHILELTQFKDAKDIANTVRQLTHGQGVDIVMGLAGVAHSLPQALRVLAPGGRLVEIGNIGIGPTAQVDPGYMVLRGLTIHTSVCYEPWALGAAVEFLAINHRSLPLGEVLSHRFPLDRINEAFERADSGEVIRATLVMEG